MVGRGLQNPRHVIIRVLPDVTVVLPGARTIWAGSTLKDQSKLMRNTEGSMVGRARRND